MWIRTVDTNWYIFEVRGVCFVSWVSSKDKANAAVFPKNNISRWVSVLEEISGHALEAVEPF